MISVEKYLEIAKENVRHNLIVHAGIAGILLCLSPLVLGVKNLPPSDTAKVLEMYVALIGIILIPPVFLPEQNPDLRDLIRSKYTKISVLYSIRIAEAVLVLALFLGAYIGVLHMNGCQMDVIPFYAGTFAEMIFMGGLGLLFYSLTDNLIAGYMIPVFYYITAIGAGSKYLKMFYPFSLTKGSFTEKYWLLAGGIILIAAAVCFRSRK